MKYWKPIKLTCPFRAKKHNIINPRGDAMLCPGLILIGLSARNHKKTTRNKKPETHQPETL